MNTIHHGKADVKILGVTCCNNNQLDICVQQMSKKCQQSLHSQCYRSPGLEIESLAAGYFSIHHYVSPVVLQDHIIVFVLLLADCAFICWLHMLQTNFDTWMLCSSEIYLINILYIYILVSPCSPTSVFWSSALIVSCSLETSSCEDCWCTFVIQKFFLTGPAAWWGTTSRWWENENNQLYDMLVLLQCPTRWTV